MTIENTTARPPEAHVLGILSEGQSAYIEGMEAAGQQQLVHSDLLPIDNQDREAMAALGVVFGEKSDDLFERVTLPDGWSKAGSDHAMWSYVRDERGLKRIAIFYKAAFYDRGAFCRLVNVGNDTAYEALYDGDSRIPWDVLTDDEAESATSALEVLARNERGYESEERVERAKALLAAKP